MTQKPRPSVSQIVLFLLHECSRTIYAQSPGRGPDSSRGRGNTGGGGDSLQGENYCTRPQ